MEHRVLAGDTSRDTVWQRLHEMIDESWTHASGVQLRLSRIGLDTGCATQEAYAFVRKLRDSRLLPMKGVARGAALVGLPTAVDLTVGGKKLRRGVRVYSVVGGIAKLEFYNHLRKTMEVTEDGEILYPAGYIHLPKVDAEFVQQLCSEQLATGLDLNRHQVECLVPDLAWRMGLVEERRVKPVTWYFARHLNLDTTAQRLLIHLSGHRADRSARILTSSPVPLPASSPLAQYEVVHLADLMRVSQNRFEFFTNRVMEPAAVYQVHDSATDRGTTLRHVRSECNAYIDGVAYPLEAMQANILLALIDDFDHRMEGSALRDACSSAARNFRPVKQFDRNKLVYETFIRYIPGDKEYELVIPANDLAWISKRALMTT